MQQDKNQVYLSILSKLMQEDAENISEEGELFSKLYRLINETLFEWLSKSQYADSASLIRELNHPLKTLENLLLCPELHQKCVVRIEGVSPITTFCALNEYFCHSLPKELFSIQTTIPVMVAHGEGFEISAMTYANKHVALSLPELTCVIQQAKIHQLNLENLIKYLLITTPIKVPEAVLLLDNHHQDGNKLFKHFINYHLYFFSGLPKEELSQFSLAIAENQYLDAIQNMSKSEKYYIMSPEQFPEWICNHINHQYYGLRDIFSQKIAGLLAFYHYQIAQDSELQHSMTDDLIRLGDDNQHIKELRQSTETHLAAFQKEYQELQRIVNSFSEVVREIENFLDNTSARCNAFSDFSFDTVFQCLFIYAEAGMYEQAEEYVKRLENMQYQPIDVVKQYLHCLKTASTIPAESLGTADSWAKAKMSIAVSDSWNENNNFQFLREWVNQIQNDISTGKEMYAMALLNKSKPETSLNWLINSFSSGYVPAGALLLEVAQKSRKKAGLEFLANALHPEACILLGDKEIENSNESNWIDSHALLYYKLAASTGNAPAVAKIVDIIYQEHFSKVPKVKKCKENEKMMQNAQILIPLCAWLKENNYQSMHFMEIMGVLQYCTEQFSQAILTLSGINTPASNYCKGRMYEFGDGVSIDYEQAISHYEKAGNFKNASKRCRKVKDKKQRQEEELQKEENYSESHDYYEERETTSSYSGGLCFVTTATAIALGKGDNCEELNLLRNFRDEYICRSEEGQELVLEYYRIAPMIVAKLDQQENSNCIYRSLWETYILPSIACLKKDNLSEAQNIYITMVKRLADQFGISVSDYVKQHYHLSPE